MRSTSASQHAKSASNKYKMLVCPDFFPVTKLHVMSKRKSRVDNFVEAESPLNSFKDSAQISGGFLQQKVAQPEGSSSRRTL
ncbi:hypothetical protein EB796_013400 [Bugula neritina]|uniref:Uncharacterized protein n=1 Tax=Bugula neritina TaxID=10212 RepID=A0A7J7JS68_BUGNE|nr:hypothetical protein EB796_013400 [Bugula neritina]